MGGASARGCGKMAASQRENIQLLYSLSKELSNKEFLKAKEPSNSKPPKSSTKGSSGGESLKILMLSINVPRTHIKVVSKVGEKMALDN